MHKAAALGLTSYMLPEAYGGGGIDSLVTDCLILEELAWGDGGLGALVTSGGFFAAPILELGSEEQKERCLRRSAASGRRSRRSRRPSPTTAPTPPA